MGKKMPALATDEGLPTKERLKHAEGRYEVGGGKRGEAKVHRMRDNPLDTALAKGQISGEEYRAGEKFRHHWYHGGLLGSVSSLDPNQIFARNVATMGHMAKTERQEFHRQAFQRAYEHLSNQEARVVYAVCCEERWFDEIGVKDLGYNNRPQARTASVVWLKAGLYRLAKLWGL
jgi:hypothetical protein